MKKYNIIEYKDKINFKGRSAVLNGWICLDFTASGFEFQANFNDSDLVVESNIVADTGLLGVVLDNDFENMIHIPVICGEQNITVLENLKGVHIVKIVKLLEYSHGRYEFKSIKFDGELLEKPEERPLKFEFYGDSLTCGYGNLCTTRNSPNPFDFLEHGYKTWCVHLCEKFGAEMSAVCCSGQGVVTDCTGNPEGVIEKYYNMAVPSRKIKWDFSKYVPDVVFFNIGANDMNYLRFYENAKMDWSVFKANAKKIIDEIRENAPKCKIVIPLGHDKGCSTFDGVVNAYRELIAEENYKDIALYDDITCNQMGGDWHPNLQDDIMMYEKIYNHLKEDFEL